jgi:uncharacterized protein (TIGR03437 family)
MLAGFAGYIFLPRRIQMVKRYLLFLCEVALFCFSGLVSENILTTSSAQQTGIELSLLPLPVPNNTVGTFVRGASNDGRRLVFESINNYNGGNPDGNIEVWVYDLDSQSIIQITNSQDGANPFVTVDNFTPSISGDGTKIVFYSNAVLGDIPNNNYNYEIYLADLPPGATTATITRLTSSVPRFADEFTRGNFTNVDAKVNDDGSMIVFVTTRQAFNATNVAGAFTADNPDGNREIMALRLDPGQTQYRYIQVTVSQNRNINGPASFNTRPTISGNGLVVAFYSDLDYENRNADANEEIFLSRYDPGSNRFTTIQVTDTRVTNDLGAIIPVLNPDTGTYELLVGAPVNSWPSFIRPLSSDGMRFVLESAGNLDGGATPNKARNVWLYDTISRSFRRLTNQTASPVPTQDELRRIDHTFLPSINAAGTFITFNSSLNLATNNSDGSKEIFRYEISNASLRQLTFTQPSSVFPDQRLNSTSSLLSANGDIVSFNYLTQSLLPNAQNVMGLFQLIVRPVTRTSPGARVVNGASLDPAQVARGSLSSVLGNELANSTPSVPGSAPFIVDGVSVSVGGIAARLTFVSPGRVNFVVPDVIANGNAVPFSVNNNGVQSAGTIKVVDAAPGIFSIDGSGAGMPSGMCLSKFQGFDDMYYDPPCLASGANLVSILFFFGTGWRNAPSTQVKINGMTLTPLYSGSATGGDRRDQINVVLPSNLAGLTDADLSVVASGSNLESNKLKVSFQNISTDLLLLDSNKCLTKRPGMPDEYTEPPCTVSNGTTTGILVLYGTGFRNAPSLQVKFEEVTMNPIYSGPSGIHQSVDQINILLPSALAGRTGQLSVTIPGTTVESNSVPISFQGTPTSLTILEGSAGVDCVSSTPGQPDTYSEPPCAVSNGTRTGILVLHGTGFRNEPNLQVKFEEMTLNPVYSGPSGSDPSKDQMNIVLPSSLAGRTGQISVIIPGTNIESNRVPISFLPLP